MLAIRESHTASEKENRPLTVDAPYPGFQFDLCLRNEHLINRGFPLPKAIKTGTTIAGVVFEGGVVLGADTRATEGEVVADKNCEKIHYLADNMYCCGAGTAADTEKTTDLISSQIRLHSLNTGRQVRVQTALRMIKQMLFRYGGYIGAYLVLGGVDYTGPHLFTIHAAGSTDKLPYVSMGSGSLAAMATFETGFKPDMSVEEAKILVSEAIQAGIFNDLGSGSNVDLCVITRRGVEYIRPYKEACSKGVRQGDYTYKPGTTRVSETLVREIKYEVVSATEQRMEVD